VIVPIMLAKSVYRLPASDLLRRVP
jgi:hypothetical protein